MYTFVSTIILSFVRVSFSANILCITPTAFYTHQATFRPIWRELHARGHHLTLLTTDPMDDNSLANLTEISLHFTYEIYKQHKVTEIMGDGTTTLEYKNRALNKLSDDIVDAIFSSKPIQNFIADKAQKFDLMLLDTEFPSFMAFSWHFNCPWIGIHSMDAGLHDHYLMGNSLHPLLYPEQNLEFVDSDNFSFLERIYSCWVTVMKVLNKNFVEFPREHERMKKYFGQDLLPLKDIHKNISLLFVNLNPVIYNRKSLSYNTISIAGGLHILPPKPLSKDLQRFLDSSKNGVIYFSLGSAVKSNVIKNIPQILAAFRDLPYEILWKFDEILTDVPTNVRIEKWLPQQDILRHPNIKLFITQAGVHSIQESLMNSVPMICIAYFGDQFQNAQRMEKYGAAIRLNKNNITKDTLTSAIMETINNSNYRKRANELGQLLEDQPMTGLENAIWWTEYVLRHKGATFLKPHGHDMPFYQYYLLDVLVVFGVAVVIFLYMTYNFLIFTRRNMHPFKLVPIILSFMFRNIYILLIFCMVAMYAEHFKHLKCIYQTI